MEELTRLIREDMRPALGVTEPGAIAFAVSKARTYVKGAVTGVELRLNSGMYKNAYTCGIPNSRFMGNEYAAALGLLAGKPEMGLECLAEVTEAMPMMAQHTMVVVTDLDIFRLDEQQRTALMALLTDFPEYCTLVLVYDLLPYKRDGKMKKLCAALDKSVCEVEFRQQERAQLLRWVKRRFAAAGHDIDDATADHLLFTCGSLMTELVPEIGKIAAYAKGRAVTVEDINAVADPVLDARVFDMTNSITAGKYDQAAQVLGELLRMFS